MSQSQPFSLPPRLAGFASVITFDALFSDHRELESLLAALEGAGYRRRFSVRLAEPDADGVLVGHFVLAKDVYFMPTQTAPTESVAAPSPAPTPDPPVTEAGEPVASEPAAEPTT